MLSSLPSDPVHESLCVKVREHTYIAPTYLCCAAVSHHKRDSPPEPVDQVRPCVQYYDRLNKLITGAQLRSSIALQHRYIFVRLGEQPRCSMPCSGLDPPI